jgi:hypothetical protein
MLRKASVVGLVFILLLAGCNVQEWFQIAAGLVPIVLQTVSGFQTANGGLPPSAEAAITAFGNTATAILNDVAADIQTAQTNTAVIPKIDAELKQLQAQAQALIPQFTGNAKVLAWVNAILADVIDIVNLVPVVQQSSSAHVSIVKMKVSLPAAKNYQAVFQHRLQVAQSF